MLESFHVHVAVEHFMEDGADVAGAFRAAGGVAALSRLLGVKIGSGIRLRTGERSARFSALLCSHTLISKLFLLRVEPIPPHGNEAIHSWV